MKSNRKRKVVHPFIPGWWYFMVNFPLIVFGKSGITGGEVKKRAHQVDKAAPGIPIPIFAVYCPFHYELEQWSHRAFKSFSVSYYKGDGHTEWFWSLVGVVIIPIMAAIWIIEIWCICFLFALLVSQDQYAASSETTRLFVLIITKVYYYAIG